MVIDWFSITGGSVFGTAFVAIAIAIVTIIVHVAFSFGVFQDAQKRRTQLVAPLVWAAATLVGGVFVAVAYWFVHHSTLAASACDGDEAGLECTPAETGSDEPDPSARNRRGRRFSSGRRR